MKKKAGFKANFVLALIVSGVALALNALSVENAPTWGGIFIWGIALGGFNFSYFAEREEENEMG